MRRTLPGVALALGLGAPGCADDAIHASLVDSTPADGTIDPDATPEQAAYSPEDTDWLASVPGRPAHHRWRIQAVPRL